MKIAVLGTGMVGVAVATRLVGLGHDVRMGSRSADNETATAWAEEHSASRGTFADAAAYGDLVVNATGGLVTLEVLRAAGVASLAGKVLVDISNPLDGSGGFPPELVFENHKGVAEQVQEEFADARVVKALNTVNADIMVHPEQLPDPGVTFLAGEDAAAKQAVRELLVAFGWPGESIVDLGGIRAARGLEHYVRFWVDLMSALGTARFNIALVR